MLGRIIGISAKKQGGKTTAFNQIKGRLGMHPGWEVENVMFSEELKMTVLRCFIPYEWGWELKDLDSDENKERRTPSGKTVRQLLQIVGTDMFRSLWEDVWVNATVTKIKKILENPKKFVVVTDVRFPNELVQVHKLGGTVIRLTRAPFQGADQHESETALDDLAKKSERFWFNNDSDYGRNVEIPVRFFDYFIENHNCSILEQEIQIVSFLTLEDFV